MNLKQINNLKRVNDMAVRGKEKIDKRKAQRDFNTQAQIERAQNEVQDTIDDIFDVLRNDFVDFCDTFMYLMENDRAEFKRVLNVINNLTSVKNFGCTCEMTVIANTGGPYFAIKQKGNLIFEATYPEGFDYPGEDSCSFRTTNAHGFIVDDNSPFWFEVRKSDSDNMLYVYYRNKTVDTVENCINDFTTIANILQDVFTALFEEVEKDDIEE